MQRSSRSNPRTNKEDPAAAALAAADPSRPRYPKKPAPQQQDARDFPNFRPARVFTQHMPYKSVVSVFAYTAPKEGPQAKYGLFMAERKQQQQQQGASQGQGQERRPWQGQGQGR